MSLHDDILNSGNSVIAQDADLHCSRLCCGLPGTDHSMVGGAGYGRFLELFGNEGSGKTLLLMLFLAQNQRRGGISIFGDTEFTFDNDLFRKFGGDPSKLILLAGEAVESLENFFDYIKDLAEKVIQARKEDVRIAVGWDGIAATPSRHLMEKGMEKIDMSKAKALTQGISLITSLIARAKIAVMATNQTRENIGSYDSATATPGGKAWKFACSQRMELAFDGGSATSRIIDETTKEYIGRWLKGTVVKNKLGSSYGHFSVPFYMLAGYKHPVYDRKTEVGIDYDEALFDYFLHGRYYIGDKYERVILTPSKGWYQLHPSLSQELSSKKFRAQDWPEILARCPHLNTILYDDLQIDADDYPRGLPGSDGG